MDLDAKNFMLLLRLELPEAVADDAEKHLSALLRRVRAATLREAAGLNLVFARNEKMRAGDLVPGTSANGAWMPPADGAFEDGYMQACEEYAAAILALDADKEGGEGDFGISTE